jgi:deoxyribonuclease V
MVHAKPDVAKLVAADPFPYWDGSLQGARRLQAALAARVRRCDALGPVRALAGVDVGFEEGGATARAAAVLLDAATLEVLAQAVVCERTRMPYLPGLLSFRELPAMLAALAELPRRPDLVFCDGLGIAHPRRLGIAAHLGVVLDWPTIGVAKKILVGTHAPLAEARGSRAELVDRGEVVGAALRTKAGVRPVIVSPGHRVSLTSALEWVLAATRGYRLPEPTRLADRLASRRGV